jgi:hypothetical protein
MAHLKHPKMLHSPNLDTVLMVEETIKNAKEVVSVAELKRKLPRKVNHNTLKVILTYLQKSGKIEFTPHGTVWVFMPKEDMAAILSEGRTWG